MRKRFIPPSYSQELYREMITLRQEDLSVTDYTLEFERLMIQTGVQEDESHTVARYLAGLHKSIADKVELQPHWGYFDFERAGPQD